MNVPSNDISVQVDSMAVTLDDTSGREEPPPSRPRIDLVDGVCQGMSVETHQLLASRLRMAALVLSGGFAVFLFWKLIDVVFGASVPNILLADLIVVCTVLAGCGAVLCRRCAPSNRVLRVKEVIIFGLPAIFLMQVQYLHMIECAMKGHEIPSPVAPWLLLIFTYALFIPNTWRRAAIVLAAISLGPILITVVVWLTHDECCLALNSDPEFMVELTLMMSICCVSAVLGVRTIGTLRREAFAAKQLGHYQLRRKIGAGGMGEVYLAEHQLMKRPCAIKIIRPERAGDPTVLSRFEREVQATAKLSHWNSVDIYDYGRAPDGTFYYVMEFLPGMCLEHLVTGYGPVDPGRAIFLLRQACDALREAHDGGIIHRDIKPANIFAAQRGGKYDVTKLLDFGLAKPMTGERAADLTQEGRITGSPHYMSPEQAMGEQDLDARSDIYSIGAVGYFLLAGRPPFDEQTVMRVLLAHAHQDPKPPSEHVAEVPADIEAVIMRCLAKRPQDRYANVDALIAALNACHCADEWGFAEAEDWWRHRDPLPEC